VFIRVHLWLIGLFFLRALRDLCDLCGENLSFVAAYHANYGRPNLVPGNFFLSISPFVSLVPLW
jgi:hypothetical protein